MIAIDGPAGAGKSTAARILAKKLGFLLLDTGALYRVMAMHLMRNGVDPEQSQGPIPAEALHGINFSIEPDVASMRLFLNGEEVTHLIRDEQIGIAASKFSTRPEVRKALLETQRSAAEKCSLVAEGRDMGTVVFPHAKIKFFVTADVEERSHRRCLELLGRGQEANFHQVLEDMRARDLRDRTRREAPLVQAEDAIFINTTNLNPEQVLELMVSRVKELGCFLE
ncbi:MAG: (d)CMP kinase [Desulfomonile tiedjei]|uniref:Cytidylate kinase n=1 Tax=Desulfomonile tiedjei TaxID=2358 RepID=A0A9D6V0A2_9BACT|nr:(d)CMP kinase [Desulfomonile tiedjei]